MKKRLLAIICIIMSIFVVGCNNTNETTSKNTNESDTQEKNDTASETKIIVDSLGREVEVLQDVKSVVCVGVGGLRYTSYMDSVDLIVGVEDYEQKQSLSRPYNYVNYNKFKDLPVIGSNGEPNVEEITLLDPDVIVCYEGVKITPEEIQKKTGIPVVAIPVADSSLDEKNYQIFEILGQLYNKEDRAKELTDYLDEIKLDLEKRTSEIKDEDKPTCYVGGVSFKGAHGFEGTEGNYGPFTLIGAKNLADELNADGFIEVDLEKVLDYDPDIIFLDYNGMDLINEQYSGKPDFFENLSAYKNNKIFSLISYRSSATNLDTALVDTYFAGKMIFPDRFEDIDVDEKTGEIFTKFIGEDIYPILKNEGYELKQITIGE